MSRRSTVARAGAAAFASASPWRRERDRTVTVADVGLVNAVLAQLVDASNFLKDVNVSGTLSVADKAIANAST